MNRNDDRRCLPERVVRHIRHDRACGISLAKVAKIYGVSVNTVRRLCNENYAQLVRDYVREAARKAARKITREVRNERMRAYREHKKQVRERCKTRKNARQSTTTTSE